MKTLIVGAGALGGLIAARMLAKGEEVWLAVRDPSSALALRRSGLRVRGEATVEPPRIDVLEAYTSDDVALTVLATKAADAIALAPRLPSLGRVMPIQNGGVAAMLAARLGDERVVGALSNLGATMHGPGDYEPRNAGHLLVDERGADVAAWLARGVDVRTTPNFRGAVWSKLLLNCSVTTIGAIANETMRSYVARPEGRALFDGAYAEALRVALATGARPERMLVEPVPSRDYEGWLAEVVAAYGDLKPSMLQDLERGRATEIDYINGFVCAEGRRLGLPTPVNHALVELVHAIERNECRPSPANLTPIR